MFEFVGSCRLYLGDPTTALGADMEDLGFVEDVSVDLGIRMGFTSNSNIAGAPLASGIHMLTPLPVVQAQLRDGQIAKLQELVLNSVLATANLGIGSEFTLIAEANVPTLCLIPDKQRGSGAAATQGIWLPAGVPDGLSGIEFTRPQQGEIGQPYNVQFAGAYREQDQDATAIPVGHRMCFIGPPADVSLTWSLPTGA